MDIIKVNVLLFLCVFVSHPGLYAAEIEEYCNGVVFEPDCSPNEIIIMESAKYGRMKLGKCVKNDLGYLGCNADVLSLFDRQCSGKRSCQVPITETHISTTAGCMQGLLRYLEAAYVCVKGFDLPQPCSSNERIDISSHEMYISRDDMDSSCISNGQEFTVYASSGQTLNISLINLNNKTPGPNEIYGTLKDTSSSNRVVFGDGPRKRHLMTSASNAVTISLQSDSRFILHFTVFGCPQMSPPDGAWMTRDGDVMEIGCHSGAKSWSLRCEDNQWVGAVGQCGAQQENEILTKDSDWKSERSGVSPNVVVFGLGSLVILISSVIFLIGVCILKRKLTPTSKPTTSTFNVDSGYYGNAITLNRRDNQGGMLLYQQGSINDTDYKSLKTPCMNPLTGQATAVRSDTATGSDRMQATR